MQFSLNMQRANHWLDVCRALAIMLVLFSHGRRLLIPLVPEAQWLKFGGFLGVEIFFVLSGFLIGRILIAQSTAAATAYSWIGRFWTRRWLRTYPNYFLFLLINWFLLSTLRPAPDLELWRYMTFTQNVLWPHSDFFGEAWSLAIEEIFYFVTPLLMLLVWLLVRKSQWTLLLTLALLLLGSLGMRIYVVLSDAGLSFNQVRSTALLRLDSIMIGVLVAWCYCRQGVWWQGLRRASPWLAALLIPVIIIAAAPDLFMDNSQLLKVILFSLANLGAAGLIVMGFEWHVPNLLYTLVAFMARWSYSAYLVNFPVVVLMAYWLPAPTGGCQSIGLWLVFMALVWSLSALVYYGFERKVLSFRDQFFGEKKAAISTKKQAHS